MFSRAQQQIKMPLSHYSAQKVVHKGVFPPQVTTLRAAISYISGLQSLLADCEAGLVDPAQFQVNIILYFVTFSIC